MDIRCIAEGEFRISSRDAAAAIDAIADSKLFHTLGLLFNHARCVLARRIREIQGTVGAGTNIGIDGIHSGGTHAD